MSVKLKCTVKLEFNMVYVWAFETSRDGDVTGILLQTIHGLVRQDHSLYRRKFLNIISQKLFHIKYRVIRL